MRSRLATLKDWSRSLPIRGRLGPGRTTGTRGPAIRGTVADCVTQAFEADCLVCGQWGTFTKERPSLRETYSCAHCNGMLRYRAQAEAIIRHFGTPRTRSIAQLVEHGGLDSLHVYEPGVAGPFRRFFRHLPHYEQSYHWDEEATAAGRRPGVENQDLMALSFPDAVFDLVVTSDIFEHVRRPYVGFAEIRRVLKPGGMHVFSVPLIAPMRPTTVFRVDTSGERDVHLEPPHYHGSPVTGRSLVYTDFGADMLAELDAIGLPTEALELDLPFADLRRLLTFVSTKT